MKTTLLLALFMLTGSPLKARTWTEAGSGRTLEGDFVNVANDCVTIRRADGSTIKLPLSRLSEADRVFVKQQSAVTTKSEEKSAGKDDFKQQLLGTWDGFMADSDGSKHGDIRLVVTEMEITATNPQGERLMGGGTYSISKGGKFHRIDAKGTSGQFERKNYEGIFSIEGRTLKWCSANDNPRSKRPDKLQTNVQAGQFLMVLERKN